MKRVPTFRGLLFAPRSGCGTGLRRRGAILILVLWLLVILSLIGLSFSTSMRVGVRITGNRASRIKARYYAKAAIERTVQELIDRLEPYYGEMSGFYDDEEYYAAQPIGEGFFSLLTNQRNEDGYLVYGITDEASRLNINTVEEEALLTFPEITQEMAASLIDWRDDDWEMGLDGAEDDWYMALPEDPYPCKNAPFQTVTELLLVRGWTQVDLFGEDSNENGRLDTNEDDGEESAPIDDADGELDVGLAHFFTLFSSDLERDPNGEDRLALGNASEDQLMGIEGMTEQQAKSIVAWRGNNNFDSLGDLLDVTVAEENDNNRNNQGAPNQTNRRDSRTIRDGRDSSGGRSSSYRTRDQRSGGGGNNQNNGNNQNQQGNQNQQSGQKAFSFEQAAQVLDYLCVDTQPKKNRININTAPYEVLMTIPGMTDDLAYQIVTHRESQGDFTARGALREVNGMTEDLFKEMIDHVTVQSYQFRIMAEGRHNDTKVVIEAVIDVSEQEPKLLYWKES